MGRNLVVCCDGTNNSLGGDPTNVLRLAKVAQRDDPEQQIVYYDTGVGTILDPQMLTWRRKLLRKAFDQATGLSMRDNFLHAYLFLVRHWRPGDRIMLFGFSRGAYTARIVASAIHLFGLIRPESENLAAYIWQSLTDEDHAGGAMFGVGKGVAKHFGREVDVDFLGVWDTVSAFGMLTAMRTVPYTRNNPSVKVVRHAVAIDERRSLFGANRVETDPEVIKGQDAIELGFCGVHSDVGGGYPEAEAGLAMIAFEWMLGEAITHGLLVDNTRVERVRTQTATPSAAGQMHESLKGFWKLVEVLPVRRWSQEKKRLALHMPNFFRSRPLPGLAEHPSVVERRQVVRGYNPTNTK